MDSPEIEPALCLSGSAFVGSRINGTRPIPKIKQQNYLKIVSLSQWCEANFITKDTGYKLIEKKYLIAFRRHRVWWVTANPDCIEQLLEYLGIEELFFDVEQ